MVKLVIGDSGIQGDTWQQLIELSGDVETAFEIYYDTYDIHELPPLHEGS